MRHVHMHAPQEEPAYRVRLRERQVRWAMMDALEAQSRQQRELMEAQRAAEKWLQEQAGLRIGAPFGRLQS
jgi:hypothetical protein